MPTHINQAYGQLPLSFEKNRGQTDPRVKYLARGHGYTLFLTDDAASLRLRSKDRSHHPAVLRLNLLAANQTPRISAGQALPGRRHYFIGSDPQHWRREIGSFREVRYSAVYPGIDLVFYGTQGELEYDFIVAPGADPRRIAFAFSGADHLQIDRSTGDLLIKIGDEAIRQRRPYIYQEIDGQRSEVQGRYRLRGGKIGFEVGRYDQRQPLIIDPVLIYSTYLGGTVVDRVQDIAVDSAGHAYVTGFTTSTDFPGSSSIQSGNGGNEDAYVVKLNPAGTAIVYGAYLGGQATDSGISIAVDGAGNAYVTGNTASANFPTRNPLHAQLKGGTDAFIAKLNATGSDLVYSTYLGGMSGEAATSIAIDNTGNAFLTGRADSFDFPTVNARQPNRSGSAFYTATSGTWTPGANGLQASTISVLAFDPTNSATIFAGTEIGVYKSINGGTSWVRLPFAPEVNQVRAIAVDPSNSSTIYVGNPTGAYKSTDGGQTAVKLGGGLPEGSVNALVIDPSAPNTVYAGLSLFRVYKSANGGALWSEASGNIGLRFATINALAINPAMPNILYAATDIGPFRTANGGTTWSATNNNFPTSEVAIAPSNPKVVYTAGGPFTPNRIFQRSDDDGVSWMQLPYPTTSEITSIAIDPTDPYRLFLGSANGIFRSVDGGLNWTNVTNNIDNSSIQAVLIDPANPSTIYVGTQSAGDAFIAKLNPAGSALVFSTYLGGNGFDQGNGIVVDGAGNIYLAGATASTNFPTANPRQSANGGSNDAFITKLSADGQTLIYSSYYGGSGSEQAAGLAINNVGDIFFTGTTGSINLPTVNAFQPAWAALGDAFVARLKADGSAYIFATYFGGNSNDQAQAIALDAAENIYLAGATTSTNFPLFEPQQSTHGSNGFSNDAFLARFNPTGTALTYSTYFGGDGADFGFSIAVDARHNIYLGGQTSSSNFPLLNPLQAMRRGSIDGFVAQFAVQADLAIMASAAPNPVFMNGRLTYQLLAQNNGPDEALNVRLSDTLPTGATFVEATSSQGTCTGNGPVTCQLGNLLKNATATVTLVVTVPAAGNINNTASLTADTADPNAANNSVTTTTRVTDKPSIFGRARLADGTPIQGATITLGGAQSATTLTDSRGEYQFAELTVGGNYTVTASKLGIVLRPANYSFNNLNADQRADLTGVLCRYDLSVISISAPQTGGMASVQLTSADALCPWTAVSDVPWITLTSSTSGTGNALITFNIAPTTVARSGHLRIGGRTLTVFQEFNPCGAVTFRDARTVTVPSINPALSIELAAGDLTGDGIDDLAVLSRLPVSTLRVIPGNSSGGFNPPIEVPLNLGSILSPVNSLTVAIADVNGDMRRDLLVSSLLDGGSLSVILNQSDGTFSEPRVIRVGTAARRVIAKDFNNDLKVDLAFTGDGVSNITILLGNGDGSFISGGSFGDNNQTPFPDEVAVGDVNGDGKLDLISGGNNALTVFIGDGMGRFATFNNIGSMLNTRTFTAGDFNGDGRLDLALINSQLGNANNVLILLGKGDGTFNQGTNNSIGRDGSRILATDATGDGKPDLIITTHSSQDFALLTGNGDGTFRPAVFYSSLNRIGSPVTGDFNGDGRVDLATSETSTGVPTEIRLSLIYGMAGGGFITGRNFRLENDPRSVLSGDFNEDGRLDLAVGHGDFSSGPTVFSILDGNAAGEFEAPRTINFPTGLELREVVDINHDGHLDLFAVNQSARTISILLGNGRGGFPFVAYQSVMPSVEAIALADFNRDGNEDLITTAANNTLTIRLGDGTGDFAAPVVFSADLPYFRFVAGDFNGDGLMDLAASIASSCVPNEDLTIFYGDGRGGFPNKMRFPIGAFQPAAMLARDFDGDGRSELVTVSTCIQSKLLIYRTDEMGRLLSPTSYTFDNFSPVLRTADLNSDGRLDILAVRTGFNSESSVLAFYSKSTGEFSNPVPIATGNSISSITVGDFNRDSRNDLVYDSSIETLTLLLNTCQAAGQFTTVSSADFSGLRLARESIVAGFGNGLSAATEIASTVPLPTQLAGTSVRVQDSAGNARFAPLFFVSPTQINYLIPAASSVGPAIVQVIRGAQVIASETVQITNSAPAIFTATQDGRGFAAGQILRLRGDGSQSYEPIVRFDPAQNAYVPVPIDLGPSTDQVYLLLYGTGFRNAIRANNGLYLGGFGLPVAFAGPQGSFVGLDQANILLPHYLSGLGVVEVKLDTSAGQSNTVLIQIK